MNKPVRKAIFPVAGQGIRFLPATKAMPKEMLPVVDKPLIQYAVEEARDAGIEEFIFVTGRAKSAIEDHFDYSYELEHLLKERKKTEILAEIRELIPGAGKVVYTRQQQPLGLGHAVWCARYHIQDEPFAVVLADDLVLCKVGCLAQTMSAYHKVGGNLVAIEEIAREHTDRYGILDVVDDKGIIVKAKGLVEKPQPTEAPSSAPSGVPTWIPTLQPSSVPTSIPTEHPSSMPSLVPSGTPSSLPTTQPSSSVPSTAPSIVPSSVPSDLILPIRRVDE